MISHVSGTLIKKDKEEYTVHVGVNGIWYEVFLPAFVWRALEQTAVGTPIELETYYYVAERQPIPKLVGFQRDIERTFFQKFITVPKLGPTTALKALVFSVSTIAKWIETNNTSALTQLPGVGRRMADTIVATLKGKVVQEALLKDESFEYVPEAESPPGLDEVVRDATQALIGLGFGRGEAERLVNEMVRQEAIGTVEDVIRAVFRQTYGR